MVDQDLVRDLLNDPPKLHIWGGTPQVGGMNKQIGNRIIELMGDLESPAVMETGAGVSTMLFLLLGARPMTTIAPDTALRDRLMIAAKERSVDTTPLRFIAEHSEDALPRLAAAGEQIDLALIDGRHGWPTVFVDFCYLHMMLRAGGIMLVDDIQLHSCGQLFLFLRAQHDEYELRAIDDKQATFRKLTDGRYLPDWRQAPFIESNSFVK